MGQQQRRDPQTGCGRLRVGSRMNVGIVDAIHPDIVCCPAKISGHCFDLETPRAKPGRWLEVEGKGLSFILMPELKTLGGHRGPTTGNLQRYRPHRRIPGPMSERHGKAVRHAGGERPELVGRVELYIHSRHDCHRPSDLTSRLVIGSKRRLVPEPRLYTVGPRIGQLSGGLELWSFERISVGERSQESIAGLLRPDVHVAVARSSEKIGSRDRLLIQYPEPHRIGLNLAWLDSVSDSDAGRTARLKGQTLGSGDLGLVRIGRCVPGGQHPVKRLSCDHPVIIDQSIEYHATQIAGGSIQMRHLVAHFDASGVESSSFHGIAAPGPYYSLLQVSS